MPLLRLDVIEGRSEQQIRELLDAAHRAVLTAFELPERDRYQLLHEHKPSHFILQDSGLDIARTRNMVLVSMTSRPRSDAAKQLFYLALCREFEDSCGIAPSDVMVAITSNAAEEWSFGLGRAQYITGELSEPPRTDGVY